LNLSAAGAPQPELGEDFAQFVIGFDEPLRVAASHAWSLPAASRRRWEGFLAGTSGVLDFSSGMDGPVTFSPATFRSGEEGQALPLPAVPEQPRHESVRHCLADYLAALVEDRPTRWGDGGTARATLAVILSVYQSERSGQRVMLTM
jgi:predicted dehydrogenase